MTDPHIDYYLAKHGRLPTLMEWLELEHLEGGVPKPLSAELLAEIPDQLQSQVPELPSEYTRRID